MSATRVFRPGDKALGTRQEEDDLDTIRPSGTDRPHCLASIYFSAILEEMSRPDYLGEFELVVMISIIRLGEDAYGVPISREIEQQTARNVTFGSVYATLDRLERKGFVRSSLGEATPERGGRAKRYFRVTTTGLRMVRETKRILTKLWRGVRELEGGLA